MERSDARRPPVVRTPNCGPSCAAEPKVFPSNVFRRAMFLALCGFAVLLGPGPALRAEGVHREGFEGAAGSWTQGESDTRFRAEAERVQQGARSGDSCEHLRITAANGSYIYMNHAVPAAQVIRELQVSLWLRSDHPDLQMFLRVTLPLARDPATGKPPTILLPGDMYRQTGRWQHLRVEDPLAQLARQVRVLQAQFGRENPVDARLAYVDQVVLNVYGGQGATELWIDDLEVRNLVARRVDEETILAGDRPEDVSPRPKVEVVSSTLLVNDQPFMIRMIRHQGESLSWLAGLGFNAVYTPRVPEPEFLEQAKAAGLWVVCPPPLPAGWRNYTGPPPPIGPNFDPVLAWHAGGPLYSADLASTKKLVALLQQMDRKAKRPIYGGPVEDLRAFGRYLDVLSNDRKPFFSSTNFDEYRAWLASRQRLARPDALFWTTIPTQPPAALVEQWRALGRTPPAALSATSGQIRLATWSALSAGARGLFFDSDTALDASDPATQIRAKTLEQLNLELDVIGPWAASALDVTPLSVSDARFSLVMLQTNTRAKLLLLHAKEPQAGHVAGQGAANELGLVVAGLPESHEVFEFTPAGLRQLRRNRVAGGVRVMLPEFGLTTVLAAAPDALSVAVLRERLAAGRRRSAQLAFDLAIQEMEQAVELTNRITASQPPPQEFDRWLAAARANLETAEAARVSGDDGLAYLASLRAQRPVRMILEEQFLRALRGYNPMQSPYTVSPQVLPEHFQLQSRVRQGKLRGNLLPAGDCERMETLLGVGWTLQTRSVPGVQTRVEVVEGEAHGGRGSLRLAAQPSGLETITPPEGSTAWAASPEVAVTPGQLVRYRGWIKIPKPLASIDGAMLFDDHGGQELALRFHQTRGWEEFTFFRAAIGAHPTRLTLVLSGLGEVWLDDVAAEVIDLPAN